MCPAQSHSQIPRGRSTHLFPLLRARLQEVCTPSLQQALGGPLTKDPSETPMPAVHSDGESECARANRTLRKGCFPFQWGYFWLCSCSHCGNCTCPLQCGNMTSFPRMMYTKQAARKLLLIGCECVSACFYPHPPPPPLSPFSPAWAAFLLKLNVEMYSMRHVRQKSGLPKMLTFSFPEPGMTLLCTAKRN